MKSQSQKINFYVVDLEVSTLTGTIFNTLEVQGNTVPHLKGLISGRYEPQGLRCGSTYNICQTFFKSANLQHKH